MSTQVLLENDFFSRLHKEGQRLSEPLFESDLRLDLQVFMNGTYYLHDLKKSHGFCRVDRVVSRTVML